MEKPQYGRTGLLASRLSGAPVTQPRLLTPVPGASPISRPLKWYPSLLTIPQQLLDALRREEDDGEDAADPTAYRFGADPTLLTYVRVATVVECLLQHWRKWRRKAAPASGHTAADAGISRAQVAGLYTRVVEWSRIKSKSASTVASSLSSPPTTFFVPSYKLLVMREEKRVAEYADITHRSVWLLGKEPVVNDIPLEHPSCSAQHAALEMRFTLTDEAALNEYVATHTESVPASPNSAPSYTRDSGTLKALCDGMWEVLEQQQADADGDASAVWTVELQLTDLGSTNRTKLNGEIVPAMEPTTVIESDVLEFGCSTRKYVVLRNA